MLNTCFSRPPLIFCAFYCLLITANSVSAAENTTGVCQPPTTELSAMPSFYASPASQLNWLTLEADDENALHKLCGGYYQAFAPFELTSEPVVGNLYAAADRYTMTRLGEGELCGNVLLQQDTLQMRSDYVRMRMADLDGNSAKSAEFFGEVRFLSSDALVVGEHANANLSTHVISLDNPQFLLPATQARGTAKKITHYGQEHTVIEQGSYTTCAPGSNDWMLRGSHFDLNHRTGWGTVEDMRLQAGHVPLFYLPYFRFPIDSRRHTGFLYPEINNLAQPDIALPFYWDIHPQVDLVTTPRQIGGRGVLLENSLRYLANDQQKGKLFAAYLPGDDRADQQNRSQFSWLHDGSFDQTWFVHADLNSVSDNQYFDDFGNDLATNQTSYLNRQAWLSYLQPSWSAELLLDSPEIIDNAIAASAAPYQKLPELTVSQQSLLGQRLQWGNTASYAYFSQPDSLTLPYGQRLHWNSQLQLPFNNLWGFITPSVRLQSTAYQFDARDPITQDHLSRTLPSLSLDSGLIFERELSNNRLQTLEPRMFYTYTPFKDQDAFPNFDTTNTTFSWDQLFRDNRFSGVDRIGDTQQTTLAITSQLLNAQQESMARFTLGQIFYHQDRKVTLSETAYGLFAPLNALTPEEQQNITAQRSALIAAADWQFNHKLSTQNGITWDAEQNTIEEGFISLQFQPATQERWNLAYRYQKALGVDQVDLSTQYPLSLRWQLLARWNVDLQEQKTLEQITGLQYDSCCWQTTFAYHRWVRSSDLFTEAAENDYAFLVQFYFKGLGQVGSKLNDLLENSIAGYSQTP